ncbi:MAG: hypothetical protein VB091_00220 [Christensenella sp.]|nr:hypothetical protein [Christensenella sp.]
MRELIEAINRLSERDWFDYSSALLPLVLSIVAILIAINTSKRQNRIALFDIRYELFTELSLLIKRWHYFANAISGYAVDDLGNRIYYVSLTMLSLYYGNGTTRYNKAESYLRDNLASQRKITDDIESIISKDSISIQNANVLFYKNKTAINRFYLSYSEFTKLVMSVHKGDSDTESLKHEASEFLLALIDFEDLITKKLMNKLNMRY